MLIVRSLSNIGWRRKDYPMYCNSQVTRPHRLRRYLCNEIYPLSECEPPRNILRDACTADTLDCFVTEEVPLSSAVILDGVCITTRDKIVRLIRIKLFKRI